MDIVIFSKKNKVMRIGLPGLNADQTSDLTKCQVGTLTCQ